MPQDTKFNGKGCTCIKIKVFLVDAIKAYRERRDIAPFILNLGVGRRWLVNFENRPHYLQERTAIPTEYENPWAPQSVWVFWRKEMSLAPARFRAPDLPVRGLVPISTTLLRLRIQIQGCARNAIPLILHITHFYYYKSIWHLVQN